jgi:hypothetical protein
MGQLIFEAYDGNDPNGTPLGVLTEAEAKVYTAEHNDLGAGSFRINRNSSQLEWCRPDRYIKVYRDSTSSDPIGAFYVTKSGDTVLSAEEEGGEDSAREGLGPLLYLAEAIVWHESSTDNDSAVPEDDAYWHWDGIANVHAGGILVRMLEEAQARGALLDLTWDFTRQLDSNGVPWSLEVTDFQLPVGMNLLEVARKVQETGVELAMRPNLLLQAYEPDTMGTDLSATITLEAAVDIATSAERVVEASPLRSTVLVKGKRGDTGALAWVEADSAAGLSEAGRRKEGFLDAPETTGYDVLHEMGKQAIYRHLRRKAGPTLLGVIDTAGQVAFEDYRESDIVTVNVPGTFAMVEKRITSVSLSDTESGEYDVTVGFDEDPSTVTTGPSDGGVASPPPDGGGGGGGRPCSDCPPGTPYVPETGECGPQEYTEVVPAGSGIGGHGFWHSGPHDLCPELAMRVTGTHDVSGSPGYPFTETSALVLNVFDTYNPLTDYFSGSFPGEVTLAAGSTYGGGTSVAFDLVTAKDPVAGVWQWRPWSDIGLGTWVLASWDDPLSPVDATQYRTWRDGQWSPTATSEYEVRFYDPASGTLSPAIANAPSYGQEVVEQITSDGSTVDLLTNYPYAPNSLRIDGPSGAIVPTQTDPTAGEFELPAAVPTGELITLRYQAASSTGTGAGNATSPAPTNGDGGGTPGGGEVDPIEEAHGTPTTAFEFDASSLAGLTALSNAAAAEDADTTVPGHYFITPASAGLSGRYLAPPSAPWTAIARLSDYTARGNYAAAGLFIGVGTPGAMQTLCLGYGSSAGLSREVWTNPTTYGSSPTSQSHETGAVPIYLAIRCNSATSFDFLFSRNGRVWTPLSSAVNPGITVAAVGLLAKRDGSPMSAAFDYLRVWDSALTLPGT